ncbi:hypothetical protein RCL1_008466 [Eukaryota sp. TZLM3-RCL]
MKVNEGIFGKKFPPSSMSDSPFSPSSPTSPRSTSKSTILLGQDVLNSLKQSSLELSNNLNAVERHLSNRRSPSPLSHKLSPSTPTSQSDLSAIEREKYLEKISSLQIQLELALTQCESIPFLEATISELKNEKELLTEALEMATNTTHDSKERINREELENQKIELTNHFESIINLKNEEIKSLDISFDRAVQESSRLSSTMIELEKENETLRDQILELNFQITDLSDKIVEKNGLIDQEKIENLNKDGQNFDLSASSSNISSYSLENLSPKFPQFPNVSINYSDKDDDDDDFVGELITPVESGQKYTSSAQSDQSFLIETSQSLAKLDLVKANVAEEVRQLEILLEKSDIQNREAKSLLNKIIEEKELVSEQLLAVTTVNQKLAIELNQSNSKIDLLSNLLETKDELLTQVRVQKSNLLQRIENLEANIHSHELEKLKLSSELEQKSIEINELQSNLIDLQKEIDKLKHELIISKNRPATSAVGVMTSPDLLLEYTDNADKLYEILEKSENLTKLLAQSHETNSFLSSKLLNSEKEIHEYKAIILETKNLLNNVSKEFELCKEELSSCKNEIKTENQIKQQLENKCVELENELEALRNQQTNQSNLIEAAQKRLSELDVQARSLESDTEALARELEAKKSSPKSLRKNAPLGSKLSKSRLTYSLYSPSS